MSLRAATQVTPLADGRFAARIEPGWDIVGNANGGYLLAIIGRALSTAVGSGHPIAVSAHYLSPGKPGPVEIATDVLKRGRTLTTARAAMSAEGRLLVHATATFGQLEPVGASQPPLYLEAAPPTLPAPEDCVRLIPKPPFPPPFMARVEVRLHPEDVGFHNGTPSGRALSRGWFRLLGDEPHDAMTSLLAVDSFPPTVFNANLPIAWTPTVELTAHMRAVPGAGWLACQFATRIVSGGLMEIDGELWSEDGAFIAQSRQLAMVTLKPMS